MKKKRLVLIDGHALLFRAYYAFPPLNAVDGRLVNAVYGFTSAVLSVIDELEPTHIAVMFDSEGPTKRKEAYADYKAQRKPAPDELRQQVEPTKEVVRTLNMPLFEKQGYEADDLIGTVATRVAGGKRQKAKSLEEVVEVVIVTGDKDLLQLVDDDKGIRVFIPGRGRKPSREYREADVVEDLGVRADQVADLKGLAGDASDNIPGIKGVGPKTAVGLIGEFDSVEGMFEAFGKGKVEGKVGKAMYNKLGSGEEVALKSKELAKIMLDSPVEFDLEACQIHGYDKQQVLKLFDELGFKSLKNRLPDDEFEKSVQDSLF